MILDYSLLLADSQSSTASAASTNVVDLLAKGDAYVDCWFVFKVGTTFTQSGTNTVTVQLQTADNVTFTGASPVTLIASTAYNISDLTAGALFKARIPPGVKRYIRGYKSVSGNSGANYITAAVYSMFIVNDVDLNSAGLA